ncbi:MAG: exostosin family protein [Rhodoferax sp.]|nr:exostosin family protein [Rhodoferax sp.]
MLTLFAQYYVPKTQKRREEIDQCFKKNIENSLVSSFVILFEKEEDKKLISDHKKIIKKFSPNRLTYADWLKETELLAPGTLSLLVNSDIYLTDSVKHLIDNAAKMQSEKRFLALSRYNPVPDGLELNSNPHWTQDTWGVVKAKDKLPAALFQEAAFELGQPGCDNKIAYVMHSYGYAVTNPCATVCTVHVQEDTARSYDAKMSKLIGLHAFVHPVNNVLEDSTLDFDLLTRSDKDPIDIRVNNWINQRKTYQLIATGKPSQPMAAKVSEADAPAPLKIKLSYADIQPAQLEPPAVTHIPIQRFVTANYKQVAKFSERFLIYSDGVQLYCYDKYWPIVRGVLISDMAGISLDSKNPILFAEAFLPLVLEVENTEISADMQYLEDIMFWQFPCRTEGDAYDVHKRLARRSYKDHVVNVYLPLPWATFIDKKRFPSAHIKILGSRVSAAIKILTQLGYKLRVHTVCQHIRWRNLEEWLPQLGITDLWISHKEKGLDHFGSIMLHAWTLYAVNYRDKSRSKGLVYKPHGEKKTFASFIGAHMKHYPTEVRLRLNQLKELSGYLVEIKDLWHFNKVVYNYQVFGQEKEKESIKVDDVERYNDVISDSVFSLCPAGAGPNTLRLWESLAVGSIPVVLSDKHELPKLRLEDGSKPVQWEDVVVFHPEDAVETLDASLRAISENQLTEMQRLGKAAFNALLKIDVLTDQGDVAQI